MKTEKHVLDAICTIKNALKAYQKARKCKRYRPEVLRFEANRETNLARAILDIRNGTYKAGRYYVFKVYEPKERLIMALPFYDRVIQHMIVNIIEPIFEKTLRLSFLRLQERQRRTRSKRHAFTLALQFASKAEKENLRY